MCLLQANRWSWTRRRVSLLSNTPLREVRDASPVNDKRIFLVENYPKNTDKLPDNILEVQHRARDIMFSDKSMHKSKLQN